VKGAGKGTRVTVRCRSGCTARGHAVHALGSARGTAHGARLAFPRNVHVKRGAVLEVRLSAAGMTGRYRVFRVRRSGLNALGSGCLSAAGAHTACS
jgi:hypothetical protein